MKRITFLSLLLVATMTVSAEHNHTNIAHTDGHWGVGGNFGFNWVENSGSQLAISPEVIYEFNHNWGVGAALHLHFDFHHGLHHYTAAIAPFARYTPWHWGIVAPFVDLGFSLGTENHEFYGSVGATPGIALHLSPECCMIFKCGFLGFTQVGNESAAGFSFNTEHLTIGAHFML